MQTTESTLAGERTQKYEVTYGATRRDSGDKRDLLFSSAEETNKALIGVLAGIIALARDPAGSTLKLREALNEYEFKAAIEWLKAEGK